jgi:hypothetical protein
MKDAGCPTVIADKLISIDQSTAHFIPKLAHISRLIKKQHLCIDNLSITAGSLVIKKTNK